MELKMTVYEFEIEHYHAWISIIIGGEIEDFKEYLKNKYGGRMPIMWSWDERVYAKDMHSTDAWQMHVNYKSLDQDEIFYMWVTENRAGLRQHEIEHLTGDILFVRGFKYSKDSEEAWAYLNGEISQRLEDLMKSDKIVINEN